MKQLIKRSFLLYLFLLAGCSNQLLTNSGHTIERSQNKIRSWKELNEINIIMQRYDYSCGAASLATLMHYYFQEDITERDLINYIENTFSQKEFNNIQQSGLSFLEMEKISKQKGYQVASVRLQPAALKQLKGPVLVFVQPEGYRHFAVLRGQLNGKVYLADPSRGNITMPIQSFLEEWQGLTLILGKKGFGLPHNHLLAIRERNGSSQESLLAREHIRNLLRRK